jgi:iron(III) transport system substrate-binding protein
MRGRGGFLVAILAGAVSGCGKGETGSKIWIYTSIYKEVIEEMKGPLKKAIPEADVEWFQSGSENVAGKVTAELSAGRTKADLILTSDPFWYLELKKGGRLLPYKCPAAEATPAAFTDAEGAFAGVRLPVMVIGYNESALKPEELPRSWKDLADPRWKGKLAMPSPLESGTAFTTVALLSKAYGWDYFRGLRKGEILAAGGNSSVITRIETRERPVGIVLLENILKAQSRGSPVRAIYPADGVIPVNSPIAILKETPRPELAKRVYDWFFTREAQECIVKSGMYSLLPGVKEPPNARPWAEVRASMMAWSPAVLEEIFSRRDEIKARFSEIVLR